MILDNTGSGLAAGFFRLYQGIGYGGSIRYFPARSGMARTEKVHALWLFEQLSPSTQYDIYVTWPTNAGFTSDVPFIMTTPDGLTTDIEINETVPPRPDRTDGGVNWQKLGRTESSSDGTVFVRLDDLGKSLQHESYTVLDAIMAVPVP